ncbi:hypothetical protein AB5N19_11672 [Seiridium cardinale]
MTLLPEDAYHQIFSQLPQQTLRSCRLLNKQVGAIATYHAFKHLRLEAANDVHNFVNVAKSPVLRHLVRELTIDTWMGPDFSYHANSTFRPPRDFFRAMAYIRFLPDLKTLNVRFNKRCGADSRDNWTMEETYDFRYLVLDILFRTLAGEWPQAHRPLREENFVSFNPGDRGTLPPIPTEGIPLLDNEPQEEISIHTLTVSNLADFDDKRLTGSSAFKKVISSKTLTSLKLFVTTETNSSSPEVAIAYPEKYDFCQNLPGTWLSPAVAQNLRVLSLFFHDYWGWNPKFDFRAVNPGKSATSGLPKLRVLALGNYVFSHEWQVEWIASLVGHQNGRGGLEELYLDDCPIMWQARTLQPLDESMTTYETQDGDVVEHSNAGYPVKSVMTGGNSLWNPVKFSYHMRWNHVLQYWKDNMIALKVFKMGHGAWDSDAITLRMTSSFEIPATLWAQTQDPDQLEKIARHEYMRRRQRCTDTLHVDYDCRSPPPEHAYKFSYHPDYIFGVGLAHRREHLLQYVHFDLDLGPTPWIDRDDAREKIHEEGLAAYDAARTSDEESYDRLMSAVRQRNGK